MLLNNAIYIASRMKEGGIFKFEYQNSYIEKKFTPIDSPMYMIIENKNMHILLRSPFENSESGYLSCDISENGDLYNLSNVVSTYGEIACHLTKFKSNVYCVNYTSGDVTKIGEKTINHNAKDLPISHPHYVGVTPDNKYLCVTDLGQDLRHLVFSNDGKYVFTANELKSTVSVLEYNDGDMHLLDTKSCLPENYDGESYVSAIRIYKNEIFVANRGHNSISKLSFDGKEIKFIESFDCKGKIPRDFIFHSNRIICANQDSNNVTVFEEKSNGKFEFIQQIDIDEPICVMCGEE